MNNQPNRFGGVICDGTHGPSLGSPVCGTNGRTQTITTIGGVVHVMVGRGCTVTKPAPKVAPKVA